MTRSQKLKNTKDAGVYKQISIHIHAPIYVHFNELSLLEIGSHHL